MEGASGLNREVTSREAAYSSARPALAEERTWSWTRQGVDTASRLQLSRSYYGGLKQRLAIERHNDVRTKLVFKESLEYRISMEAIRSLKIL